MLSKKACPKKKILINRLYIFNEHFDLNMRLHKKFGEISEMGKWSKKIKCLIFLQFDRIALLINEQVR